MGDRPLNRLEAQTVSVLLRSVAKLFPPGTSIPTSTFLAAAVDLLGANVGSLTLLRPDVRRGILVTFDNITYKLHGQGSTLHKQNLMNLRAWEGDPIARRLLRRVVRRPMTAFTYDPGRWIRRHGLQNSFAAKMLQTSGWQTTLSMLIPMDTDVCAILSIVWLDVRPTTREQARQLYHFTMAVHNRVIDLRGRRLRQELPASVRQTFEMVLSGVSEKEIASATKRKVNTVHDQVKRLYSHFGVNSRAQLMAKFIDAERLRDFKL